MSRFLDLQGTTQPTIQVSIGGAKLKNNSGVLESRNAADSAYADFGANNFNVYGTDVVLNAGATESGASWKFTLRWPSSDMTADQILVLPPGPPSNGQALTVGSYASGIITAAWATVGGSANAAIVESTALAFGSTSPVAMFTLPANAVVMEVKIVIDTSFNGTPSVSVGITGTTSKYMGSTQVDLTAAAQTVFSVDPGLAADASSESLIATYSAGGATAGAARILVTYAIPA